MASPFPCPTKVWHTDTHDAIEPTKPELKQTGKTIIITGAGSGIGRAVAIAYAKASAAHIVLIGRTESTLKETEGLLPNDGSLKVSIFACSVTDEVGIRKIAEEVGKWDVLILNAGRISTPGSIVDTDLAEWWNDYEVNVKSIAIAAQAFIPIAAPNASIFTIGSACFSLLPAKAVAAVSGYLGSKLTQIRVMEFLAAQHPELMVCTVHPGIVKTKVFDATGSDEKQMPMDKVELPANFLVWLSQPKTKFLHGKTVWVNWDVDELCERAEEIEKSDIMTLSGHGWELGLGK